MTMEEFLKDPTVKNFCNLENADKFDFTNYRASTNYQLITDPIEKYFIYKAYHTSECDWHLKNGKVPYQDGLTFRNRMCKEFQGIIDPDSCSPLLQEIYKELWDKKYLVDCTYKGNITGETLNSVQTTLNSTIEIFNLGTYFWRYGRYSIKYAIALFAAFSDAFSNELRSVPQFEKFLSVYHTLGNFMPVPVGCNSPRGFKNAMIEDYWDITLKIIYEYYTGTNDNDRVAFIVKGCRRLEKKYKGWLDSFVISNNRHEGWQNFVKKNYLQAFVTGNEERYGVPKELWEQHFLNWENDHKNGALPKGKKDIEQFYDRASKMILERGYQMVEELRQRTKNDIIGTEPVK